MIQSFADLVRNAQRVLMITGAGISADSGLPTYRGVGGLYEDAATEEGLDIEDALSGPMLHARPDLCWKYIAQIEAACRGAKPNDAHRVVAKLEREVEHLCVLTQNVDGFHLDAGSTNVIEIHGNLRRLSCTACDAFQTVNDYSEIEIPPRCKVCGGIVRPRVVLFGEMLPEAAVESLQRELVAGFDLVVSIGTTSAFPYIAAPVEVARRRGVPTVEINPAGTAVSHHIDLRFQARAVPTLSALWEALAG